MAEPTGAEILMWALINRARLDPGGEAARYSIDLNEGPPRESANGPVVTLTTTSKQPLAWNSALYSVADQHSQDMLNSQTLFHDPQQTHEDKMRAAGYNFSWWGENVSESSTLGTSPSQSVLEQAVYEQAKSLFVDTFSSYRGHRVNILNDNFQEVGVGEVVGNFQGGTRSVITEDFGRPLTASQFLTGIAYNDNDGNKFYSIGEGRGGISIATSAGSVATGTAGAYSKALAAGTQTVTFSGGDLAAPVTVNVTLLAGRNAMVDLIGQSTVETSASLTAVSNVTKIIGLGNTGLTLIGNGADNAIVSALGNDNIDGGAGIDTAVYSGNRASYTITNNANGTITVSGLDGSDTLTSIEKIQFADQTVVLSGAAAGSVAINDVIIVEGNSGTKTAVFTVTRTGGTAAFDVNFATSDGTATAADGDYVAASGKLSFGANVTSQTISVTINGDTKFEGNETFNVNLSSATNGATISDSAGVGTISNDDTAPANTAPVVTAHDVAVAAHGSIAASSMFTAHDQQGDNTITQYAFWDGGSAGGHFTVNGVEQAAGQWIYVNAASLATVNYVGGSATGSESLFVAAYDGQAWSAFPSLTASTVASPQDFNGDGMSDILWINNSGSVAMWQMDGNRVAVNQSFGSVSADWHVEASEDFDGDGHGDILWRNDNGSVALWEMNGTQIASNHGVASISNNWHIEGSGDFDGDGTGDLLWRHDDGTTYAWLMDNGQRGTDVNLGQISNNWHIQATGDFNGDGQSDLLWRHNDGTTYAWLMDNGQRGTDVNLGQISTNWHIEGTGDFNGDGQTDLLWRHDDGTTYAWLMQDGHRSADVNLGQISNQWHIEGTGDFNGDGQSDILWRHDDGTTYAWLMDDGHRGTDVNLSQVSNSWTIQQHHYDIV